jgi:histidyl-tRNA synthetase
MLGYSVETPLESLKMGAMFKKATKRKAKYALIIGEDELAKGVAQLKDLNKQEQKEIKLADLEEELDKAFGIDEDEHHHEG